MAQAWRPVGSEHELRVGLAGLGSMGRNHLRVLRARPGCRLVAVADPVPEALAAAVGGGIDVPDALGFAEPLAMIAEADLDAVVIAAPTTSHRALAIAAIERGLAVLIEKPLAVSVDEGLEILAAARRRRVPVQVGHVERFNPAVLELGRLLGEGWLSTIYAITSRRAGPFPARIRDVGVTIDLATHDADILSWVAGERPDRVYAERIHASHEDLLFGLLRFPSGATGMLDVNWLTPAKRRLLTVVGEEGMFELDYLTQRLTFTRANARGPDLIAGYAPTFAGDVAELPVAIGEPLAAELDAFLTVVRDGGRPVVDVEDGLWAVAIATSLLDAAAAGHPIDLSDFSARLPVA
jgi:predicted dehydrogenase